MGGAQLVVILTIWKCYTHDVPCEQHITPQHTADILCFSNCSVLFTFDLNNISSFVGDQEW